MSDFAQFEREGWERVATRYEDAWSGLTRAFIPHLLDALDPPRGSRLLDVACGPGYAADAARARGLKATGLDFSAEMIRLARQRYQDIEFRIGNAQALPFGDAEFDFVAMNFGILHLPEPEQALREVARVLRSGGRLGFTVWAGPAESEGAKIVDDAMTAHADLSVPVPQGPDYSVFGRPEDCRQILGECGFDPDSVAIAARTENWRFGRASFVFESERDAGVRTAGVLAAQTPEALKKIAAQIEESVRKHASGDEFAIPYSAYLVTATARQ